MARDKAQLEASKEEQAKRAAEMKTRGRKGCKAIRFNASFTPENHDFLVTMSSATGTSMTKFLNILVTEYRREHPDVVESAKKVLKTVEQSDTLKRLTEIARE